MNKHENQFSQESNQNNFFDICIAGGGLSKLLLGCQLAQQSPQRSICLIDPEIISCGNSAKDPGFATRLSFSQFADDCRRIGACRAVNGLKERLGGLATLLRQLDGETTLAERSGSYEIVTDKNIGLLGHLDEINKILFPVFNEKVFEVRNEKIGEFGLNEEIVQALVFHRLEWQLNIGKILSALLKKFQGLGGRYLTGFGIVSCESRFFEENPNVGSNKKFQLKLTGGGNCIPPWSIFCQELICWERPKRRPGSYLVTAPVPDLSFSTSFYLSDPACYVRTIGNRILIEVIKSGTQQNLSLDQSRFLMSIITQLFPTLEVRPDFVWQGESGGAERPILRIEGMAEDLEVDLLMGEERIGGIGGEVKMVDRVYRAFFGQRARL